MTSSPANETVEGGSFEQPSLAAPRVSTLTDPWSEDEDEDDDDGGVRNSLELVSASRELDRDAEDDTDEEGFDLVNSRDLRSSSPVSIVSMSSRHVVSTGPSPQSAAVTSSSSKSEDLVKALRPGEPAGTTRTQSDTDTESWRSSSSASDCSASVGGGTTNTTKSSISVSGSGSESESGRSHDGEDDHAAGAMRLSFPDPIAASLNGHEPATHDQQINDVPKGLEADYSMLLDAAEAAPAVSTASSSSASLSSAAASVPASPMSDASRQSSEMSISPDKQAVSSPSLSSSSGTNSSDQIADEMMSTSTSPLLMTTSTPPSPPPRHSARMKQQRRRRSSSPTPLSRSDASLAKQSLLVEQPHALDRDHEEQQRQQYSKSYDPAHVHDWIRSAAEASSPSSSPKPKFSKEEQEDMASDTDAPEGVSCVEDQAEQPPVDSEESMQHIEGGEAVRQQQPEQEPAKHDLTTSLAGPQSMTSSEATVVPGGGIAKAVSGADGSVPGAMPESRDVSEHSAQAQEQEEEEADTTSSSMQAYAHAPGTARSRKAVAVLSFVAAAVAIAASGWLDSTSTTLPAPVRTLPSSASAPDMNCNAAATTTEEVMMSFSETIRALMMETMVAESEAEAGGAMLITAMSIVSSDHDDNDDDEDEEDDQSLSVTFESPHACHTGSDPHSVEPVETRAAPALVHVHKEEASELDALPEERSVFAPGTKLRELEQLVVSRAQRRMHRHRQRRRGSLRRQRRELLSLFDHAAPPVVHAPNPPVMYVPPAADGTKRRRAATAPVDVAAADISASPERGHESSWLSAWLRPSAAGLVARVSTNALASSLKHGRHALESANHGRRKLARHLERDLATVTKDLQRQRERVNDFTARHRATCKRSPHLPECFLARLAYRSQRDAKSWWGSIRTRVGGNRQDDLPRSWIDLIKRGRRKADATPALDRAYSRVAPFLARQLETLRLGTRRAQPLTYRGGQETVNHARKAIQALKRLEERVGKRFSAWRRGATSREGRRRKKNKTKNRSRRG